MRLFNCHPYRVKMTTTACAARYNLVSGSKVTPTVRAEQKKCFGCAVGACHKRGVDAPGVDYEDKTLTVPKEQAPQKKRRSAPPPAFRAAPPLILGCPALPPSVKMYGPGDEVPLANGETYRVPPTTPMAVMPVIDGAKTFGTWNCKVCREPFTKTAPAQMKCPKCKKTVIPVGRPPDPPVPPPYTPEPAQDLPPADFELTDHGEPDPEPPRPPPAVQAPPCIVAKGDPAAWLDDLKPGRIVQEPKPMATPRQVLELAGFEVQELRTPSGWVLVVNGGAAA